MAKRLWDKGESLDSQVQKFTIGNDPITDLAIVPWDVAASAAHARMLHSIDVLSKDELNELLEGLVKLKTSFDKGEFQIPYELEDCHTAIENFLVEELGETGKKIHTGRSRNDQVLVATRLYLRDSICQLLSLSTSLANQFLLRAEETLDKPMPGHTHFQRAMPTSFGVWFHSFAETLLGSANSGLKLLETINCNPLGAASGFGVPIPLDRALTAKLLGFNRVQRNPISVINSRGQYELQCVNWCLETVSAIEKFAFDLVLFSSEEFGLTKLPMHFTTGSSIMPQKRNPDVAELMRARVSTVRGAAAELEWVIAKLPSNYHRDHQLTKDPLIRAINTTAELISMADSVAKEIKICAENAEKSLSDELFATYEAYRLVAEGSSFREAYAEAAKSSEAGTLNTSLLRNELDKVLGYAKEEILACKKDIKDTEKSLSESSKAFKEATDSVLTT
ncbi:UNVERIFIED_CONTAM: hypothetical protein GTU68_056818 [Idotea baltica]|nr:hypothetical protein [Idotea baltica]